MDTVPQSLILCDPAGLEPRQVARRVYRQFVNRVLDVPAGVAGVSFEVNHWTPSSPTTAFATPIQNRDLFPELADKEATCTVVAYRQERTEAPDHPGIPLHWRPSHVPIVSIMPLSNARVELTFAIGESSMLPLVSAIAAFCQEQWPDPGGEKGTQHLRDAPDHAQPAGDAEPPSCATPNRADNLPESQPPAHNVTSIPGPVPSVAGVPYTHQCVFCGDYWPAEAILLRLPLCLHCARFELQTLNEADRQQRASNITNVRCWSWSFIEIRNETFACLECRKRYLPSGKKIELGIEHMCLACVIHGLRNSGRHRTESEAAIASPEPASEDGAAGEQYSADTWKFKGYCCRDCVGGEERCVTSCRLRCRNCTFLADLASAVHEFHKQTRRRPVVKEIAETKGLPGREHFSRKRTHHGIRNWDTFVSDVIK